MSGHIQAVGLGEVLWDLLPAGPQLGGAPANFACHAAALGAEASVISRVGDDPLGRAALEELTDRGLDVGALCVEPDLPTGTVVVTVEPGGNPCFSITEGVAWDALTVDVAALERVRRADVICFGSLAQRTPQAGNAIQDLVAAAPRKALRIFDINLRAPFQSRGVVVRSLEAATVLKLNETELPVLAGWFDLCGDASEQLEELGRRFGLEGIALTLGAAGSRLWRGGVWHAATARPVSVRDAVGAGDAFTAALAIGWLRGWEPATLLESATDVATFVCTQPGATPRLPDSLVARFRTVETKRET